MTFPIRPGGSAVPPPAEDVPRSVVTPSAPQAPAPIDGVQTAQPTAPRYTPARASLAALVTPDASAIHRTSESLFVRILLIIVEALAEAFTFGIAQTHLNGDLPLGSESEQRDYGARLIDGRPELAVLATEDAWPALQTAFETSFVGAGFSADQAKSAAAQIVTGMRERTAAKTPEQTRADLLQRARTFVPPRTEAATLIATHAEQTRRAERLSHTLALIMGAQLGTPSVVLPPDLELSLLHGVAAGMVRPEQAAQLLAAWSSMADAERTRLAQSLRAAPEAVRPCLWMITVDECMGLSSSSAAERQHSLARIEAATSEAQSVLTKLGEEDGLHQVKGAAFQHTLGLSAPTVIDVGTLPNGKPMRVHMRFHPSVPEQARAGYATAFREAVAAYPEALRARLGNPDGLDAGGALPLSINVVPSAVMAAQSNNVPSDPNTEARFGRYGFRENFITINATLTPPTTSGTDNAKSVIIHELAHALSDSFAADASSDAVRAFTGDPTADVVALRVLSTEAGAPITSGLELAVGEMRKRLATLTSKDACCSKLSDDARDERARSVGLESRYAAIGTNRGGLTPLDLEETFAEAVAASVDPSRRARLRSLDPVMLASVDECLRLLEAGDVHGARAVLFNTPALHARIEAEVGYYEAVMRLAPEVAVDTVSASDTLPMLREMARAGELYKRAFADYTAPNKQIAKLRLGELERTRAGLEQARQLLQRALSVGTAFSRGTPTRADVQATLTALDATLADWPKPAG